jgi:transposase-like protein
MAKKVSDTERQAIIQDIETGELSRNAIARKYERSVSTITGIAQATGQADAFDRSVTENGTRARQTDLKSRRQQLQSDLLDDVVKIRTKFFSQYTFAAGTKDGIDTIELVEPDAASLRNYVTSAAVLLDKHLLLVKHESDTGADGARGLIGGIMAAIQDAAGLPLTDPDS